MENTRKHTKRFNQQLHLVLVLLALVFTLSACSDNTSPNKLQIRDKVVVANDKLYAPLPAQITELNSDNLIVAIGVNGDPPQPCNNLEVDQVAGTFSCNISLPAGSYSLVLQFTVNDDVYGEVIVATSSAVDIDVASGQTTEADFSTATYTYLDNDNDGVSNLDELYAGTNPGDSTCILDTSQLDGCTLG